MSAVLTSIVNVVLYYWDSSISAYFGIFFVILPQILSYFALFFYQEAENRWTDDRVWFTKVTNLDSTGELNHTPYSVISKTRFSDNDDIQIISASESNFDQFYEEL